jgi:hypothetical protein
MSFVNRELDRIAAALADEPLDTERWKQLHTAQQALKWTTEPRGFAAPLDYIDRQEPLSTTGTPAAIAGCSSGDRPPPS